MIEQKPLSLALRISYFASSFVFAVLMTIASCVAYLGMLPNPALNRIDIGGLMLGMLFMCTLLVAASWFAYLPLRRHHGLVRIATIAFSLVIVMSAVLMGLIDWG